MADFARYTPRDFERLVRWINNHSKSDEGATHEWVEKATENVDLSPAIDPKLSMAAKRHLVFNFWELGFDRAENKIFYIPPDQDNKKIWSLVEACKMNFEEDAILEEETGPLKGLAKSHLQEEINEQQISLQGLIWQEVDLGQQSSPSKWLIIKNIQSGDSSQEKRLENALEVLSLEFPHLKELITLLIYNIEPFDAFYSCILENDGEVASVATFRVHNTKSIAEIPFVATRVDHRGRGVCKILMKQLEHSLKQLKVEHILLPSCQDVKEMWKRNFGFEHINDKKLEAILEGQVKIINFPDTQMCHKSLI